MINNNAPAKMILGSIAVGYTKALVYHSPFTDPDAIGKAFWVKQGNTEVQVLDPDLTVFYTILSSLKPGLPYSLSGAYWDSMVDSEMLKAKVNINISDSKSVTTLVAPVIKSYSTAVTNAEVGVGVPYLFLDMEGTGQLVEVQSSLDSKTWTTIYSGELTSKIEIPNLTPGTYKMRCRGRVSLPDGFTTDISDWSQFAQDVKLNYAYVPPSKPTNIKFAAARIKDGMERYDIQVSWAWDRGKGTNIREFVLYYTSEAEFAKTQWTKASRVNSGASKDTVLTSFPWDIPHVFKVVAIAWGPEEVNSTSSDNYKFHLNSSTPLNNDFTKLTGIEVTYSHIKGQRYQGNKWEQTFLLRASDGGFSLGLLDASGVAPISFDPISGTMNVDGAIISKTIYAANFVLSNLSGKDNPAIYSTGKTYGSANSGVWMGVGKDNKARLDVGNKDSFLRFDGDKVHISAGVTIGMPNGDISIGEGIIGLRQVFIYKVDTGIPTLPTDTAYPPAGWSKTPPSISDPFKQKVYSSTGNIDPITDKLASGLKWSQPVQWSGTTGTNGDKGDKGNNGVDGQSAVYSYILGNPATTPTTPTGIAYPPSGWSKTTPSVPNSLTQCVYATLGTLNPRTNTLIAGTTWGVPVKLTGNDGSNGKPGDPGKPGKPGEPGKPGSNGANGTRGPGFYRQGRGAAGWSDADATSFFKATFNSTPVQYDVLTQYLTSNPQSATTKQWNGTAWGVPALMIHGDTIMDGTLTARKLVADNAFFAQAGINIIYDRAAALATNPEAVYKMKIDLQVGSIHIR